MDAEVLDPGTARAQLLQALRLAHRRWTWRRRRHGLIVGLRAGTLAVFGVVLAYGVWRIAVLGLALPPTGPSLSTLLVIAAGALGLALVLGVLTAARRGGSLADCAERLDLAAGNQNRVATALEFSGRTPGPFEAAAIRDGLQTLAALRQVMPAGESCEGVRRFCLRTLIAAAIILYAATWIPSRVRSRGDLPAPPSIPVAEHAASSGPGVAQDAAAPPEDESGARTTTAIERRQAGAEGTAPEGSGRQQGAVPGEGRRKPAAGRPGKGKNVEAREARQSSQSQGDPTEGATPEAGPKPNEAARRRKQSKKPDPSRLLPKSRKQDTELGGTVGQAGSGGGAMSPVRSPWSQKDRTTDEPLPENPGDEDVEDEESEEETRGGTQPTLKDRRGATSRDLSISGPGEGGEGRGGPSPQKKARGTASLVLGIPVPDFVRGLLNPGTTKVTHERVEPVPAEGDAAAPIATRERGVREPVMPPPYVRPALRAAVKRFLIKLHSADREEGS